MIKSVTTCRLCKAIKHRLTSTIQELCACTLLFQTKLAAHSHYRNSKGTVAVTVNHAIFKCFSCISQYLYIS